MIRDKQAGKHTRRALFGAFVAAMAFSACIEEGAGPTAPLLPPQPPTNPAILSAAWRMDVDRAKRVVKITPPTRGLDGPTLQLLGDYFGVEQGSPDLSILAGDVVDIVVPGTLTSSAVGAFAPGQVRTNFNVAVRNKLTSVNLITPTFPTPPVGTTGVILFPFEIVVTETPGGVTVGGDGTDVLVELPNRGLVAPSIDWDVAPFNFFNDTGCGPTSNDCYRSETFLSQSATAVIQGGATSQSRQVGFDHDPTVSQFRVRMILAGDLQDAVPNVLPTAEANGPYADQVGGAAITLSSTGSTDPDGSITAYAWDLDDDGQYDDSTSPTPSYNCTSAGAKTIRLRVTDNRGGQGTDVATVNCTTPANQAPVAEANGPYSGTNGSSVALSSAGSNDPDGTITAFAWDLDNNGSFETAGASPSFACVTTGAFTVRLQVTDNGTPGLTNIDTAIVNCAPPAAATIRARWVDASGNAISSIAVGGSAFLDIDIQLGAGNNVHDFQAVVQFASQITAPNGGADLSCSNPGGQATCPSGAPASGNTDVMNQYTGSNSVAGQVTLINFSNNPVTTAGTGIQGLAKLQFTGAVAGSVTPTIVVQAADNGAGAPLNPAVIAFPALTVTTPQ